MDKLLLIALGLGLFIAAVSDDKGAEAPTVEPAPGQRFSQAVSGAGTHATYTVMAPASAAPPFVPVNPIPKADALGGKVIDDRHQPDE